MVGKWYRQLMGESIGKDHKRSGKKKLTGITPTVAVGSTDLHSMVQLYLGGPHDKFTTFVTVPTKNSIKLPHWKQYDPLVKDIQGKNMGTLMGAILKGVKTAYANQQRPFCEIKLPAKDEYSIGALLQFKMIEMMYLGALLNVNPFDQENVEAYKKETRRILRK
jgi:glucose-6-phosphate isomerase